MKGIKTVLLLVMMLVVLSPAVLALSFASNPSISPSSNLTTTDSFYCEFTPSGGSLTANITWFRNGILWSGDDQNTSIVDSVLFQSNPVDTTNTAKSQSWLCQVTINNISDTLSMNSSTLTLVNALPIISDVVNQTVYEDSLFSLQMAAVDPDTDSLIWLSVDQNSTFYGNPLFTISLTGLITFTQLDESLVGNHSMIILANDLSDISAKEINFELIAVNDAPILTPSSLETTCFELALCNYSLLATDEEDDVITFTANESFINISSSGLLNFTPNVSHVGNHLILINVSDGMNWTTAIFNFTVNATNHAPLFTYNSSAISSGIQNQSVNFTYFLNATDSDPLDSVSFSIVDNNCSLGINPWSITTLTNGLGSTNASAIINVNISNNDFIVCRDVRIIASDGKNQTIVNITFDINNSNDAPYMHELSNYIENSVSLRFNNTNMSNVTAAKGLPFAFRVNVTDVDELTYEGEVLSYSLIGHDPSLYTVNASTGLVTSIASLMNDSYVGNTSFLVVVIDDEGLTFNRTLNITIINNSFPIPYPINNSDCIEDVLCYKEFWADDAEGNNLTVTLSADLLASNNITYTLGNAYLLSKLNMSFETFNGSLTNYSVYFAPDDSLVGNLTLRVNFTDDYGDFAIEEVNFSIANVNDVPYLGDELSSAFADPLTFPVAAQNLPFIKNISAIDGDTYYDQDNLSFNYSFLMGGLSINMTKLNKNLFELSFTPSAGDVGTHEINITVIDSLNVSSSKVVNFDVYGIAQAPSITDIKPYLNASNSTIDGFSSSLGVNDTSIVYVDENRNLTFDILATDLDNLDMIASWYVDGVRELSNVPLVADSSFTHFFGYNDSGILNVTVHVTDKGIAKYTWLVGVNDVNQEIMFMNNLSDLTAGDDAAITGTQVFSDFFRLSSPDHIVFLDPDDDDNSNGYIDDEENSTLVFSFNSSSSCDSYAEFTFVNERVTIEPSQVGNCTAQFVATDTYNTSVSSNVIRIDILDLGQSSDTQTSSSSSSGGTKTVTRTITVPIDDPYPSSVKFIFPGISSLYSDGTVIIPFRFTNNWEAEITNIDLSFNASIDDLEGELSLLSINSLAPGASIDFNLTYFNYRFEAPFEVNLSAAIGSLEHVDVATVFINALEKGSYSEDAVKTRVGFARDLLNDNSDCQELNEILTGAENEVDPDVSLKLINSVIDGCKYLINTNKEPTREVPGSFLGKVGIYTENYIDYKLLLTIIIGMVLLSVSLGVFSRFKLKKI